MVGNTEDANSKETQENWAFLQAVSSTGPFKELHSYLAKKGKVSNSMVSKVRICKGEEQTSACEYPTHS